MKEGHFILSLQESVSKQELQEKLKLLKVADLQLLCKETGVKRLGRKAELIGWLLTNWQLANGNSGPCSSSTLKSLSLGKSVVDVHKIQSWKKRLVVLADFAFVHLYN